MNPDVQKAIVKAVSALSLIPFAPIERHQREQLMSAIAKFADRPDALEWTVEMAVAKWHKWLGIAELRGIYCSRFKPADGIEADCVETTGLTADDNEAAYLETKAAETDRNLAEWKREARRLPESERKANQQLQEAAGWHARLKRIQ